MSLGLVNGAAFAGHDANPVGNQVVNTSQSNIMAIHRDPNTWKAVCVWFLYRKNWLFKPRSPKWSCESCASSLQRSNMGSNNRIILEHLYWIILDPLFIISSHVFGDSNKHIYSVKKHTGRVGASHLTRTHPPFRPGPLSSTTMFHPNIGCWRWLVKENLQVVRIFSDQNNGKLWGSVWFSGHLDVIWAGRPEVIGTFWSFDS